MKRLLLFCMAALAVCAGMLYWGVMPDEFYEFVDTYAPLPVSGAIQGVGQERGGAAAVASPAPPREALALPGEADPEEFPDIAQRVIDGVLAMEEGIRVPVLFPEGDDDEITDHLLRQVELAIDVIRREKPEIFWLSLGSYNIEWSGSRESRIGALTVYLSYCHTPREVERLSGEMRELAKILVAAAPNPPAESLAFFHDWIVENTAYATYIAERRASMRGYEYGFNIDGVFVKGSAVCEGYTKAFKLLCDLAGIPCRIVYGIADGENHSWNYVQLDGNWYLVDVTWDDPVSEQDLLLHEYFLKGSESEIDGRPVRAIYREDGAVYPALAPTGYYE